MSVARRFAVLAAAAIGVSMMMYPAAASWFSDQAHAAELSAYASQAQAQSDAATRAILNRARAYNESLPPGQLRDPYVAAPGSESLNREASEDYHSQLRLPGTQVMAQIAVPSLHVSLPVYHGTSSAALAKGAGHLFGSSLPVGGAGTHAVLSAHSGLPEAEMFTNLEKVRLGDVFIVTVLGEDLTYRVDDISVVEPADIAGLNIVPGEDYVTLVTCTPIHVNSHRLLVRGTRVEHSTTDQRVSADATASFPWWIVIVAGTIGAVTLVLFAPTRERMKPRPRDDAEERAGEAVGAR
jgi:sortase A